MTQHLMIDALMSAADREEALSRAYVDAMAAGAGYITAEMKLDRDGVDVQIRAGGKRRPTLDIQLKATINLGKPKGGTFRFSLKRRNYDLLIADTITPRILVVLDLPRDEANRLQVTPNGLIIRRCAYWATLGELGATRNKESVTVPIKSANRFDVESLRALMERARRGVIA